LLHFHIIDSTPAKESGCLMCQKLLTSWSHELSRVGGLLAQTEKKFKSAIIDCNAVQENEQNSPAAPHLGLRHHQHPEPLQFCTAEASNSHDGTFSYCPARIFGGSAGHNYTQGLKQRRPGIVRSISPSSPGTACPPSSSHPPLPFFLR
jgi:hypothetical protein